MKTDLQEKINIIDKTELIMNILNYKIYEIRYNFRQKIDSLKEAKDSLTAEVSDKNESEIALRMVEMEKEISECEISHESQMRSIKEQKLVSRLRWLVGINTCLFKF